jgi:hypothetical protein
MKAADGGVRTPYVYLEIRPVEPCEEAQPEDVIHVEVREQKVYPLQIGRELLAHGADSGAGIEDHSRVRCRSHFGA